MIRDNHPLLFALGNEGLNVTNSYFLGTEDSYDTEETYATVPQAEGSETPKITHIHNHNWAHDFDEMTSVLIDAGLHIEKIGEYDVTDWQSLPMLEFDEQDGSWQIPKGYPRIPLTFSIVARKVEN